MEKIIYDFNWIVPEDIPRKISQIIIEGIKSAFVINFYSMQCSCCSLIVAYSISVYCVHVFLSNIKPTIPLSIR
jgi:hypothetical protein